MVLDKGQPVGHAVGHIARTSIGLREMDAKLRTVDLRWSPTSTLDRNERCHVHTSQCGCQSTFLNTCICLISTVHNK